MRSTLTQDSLFINKWKQEMSQNILLKYPNISLKKMDKFLDSLIQEKLKDKKALIVNNYRHTQKNTTILHLVDFILEHNFLLSGSCLYAQHKEKKSLLIDYIKYLWEHRNIHKDKLKLFDNDSYEYMMEDLMQRIFKIIVNALYGALGCPSFMLYNLYNAEAVTNMGQSIISAATTGFEDFLADNTKFVNSEEVFDYIRNILEDFNELKSAKVDFSFMPEKNPMEVTERLLSKVSFRYTQKFKDSITDLLVNLGKNKLRLLYYKNNLDEFNKLEYIQSKLTFIMSNINVLTKANIKNISNPEVIDTINEVMQDYITYVLYAHPAFDKIRKTKYTNRQRVLYIDTDSTMIGIKKWRDYLNKEIIPISKCKLTGNDLRYTEVNLFAIILEEVIKIIFEYFCKALNVEDEYGKLLYSKNEYYFSRMLFAKGAKKRYVSLPILREGNVLYNSNREEGKLDVKGFDFTKAGTKEKIRNAYMDIIEYDILRSDSINIRNVIKKIRQIEKEILDSLNRGETMFYKQANVKEISAYKFPFRVSGIKGTLLWNLLSPENQLELPTDVDIVPIKSFKNKNNRKEFEERFPVQYALIDSNIFNSPNPDIRKIDLNYIAKPKNVDLVLPEWYYYLIDTEKVLLDAINLFLPILKSLGVPGLETTSKKTYFSNIVSI